MQRAKPGDPFWRQATALEVELLLALAPPPESLDEPLGSDFDSVLVSLFVSVLVSVDLVSPAGLLFDGEA